MNTTPPRFQSAHTSPFWPELKAQAQAELASQGPRHFDARSWLKAALFAAAMGLAYALCLQANTKVGWVLSHMAFLFLAMALAMNLLHDAAHGAVCRSARANRFWRRLVALPVGIDSDIWAVRHVHYHHTYANVEGWDLDTEPNPFLRQTPFQAWSAQYRFQHLHWPLVAALSLPYLAWYADFLDRFGRTPLKRDRVLPGWQGWLWFFTAKLLHVVIAVLIPAWAASAAGLQLGWGTVLLSYLAGQMLASCVLVALVLGTHWSGVAFFVPPASGRFAHSWPEHAFLTTCDWTARLPGPLPRWVGLGLGGLNWHLTHHLFPTHAHRHYPRLAGVVARVAAQHGLHYRDLAYGELFAAQQRFLREMGQRPEPAPLKGVS
jgi:linoleoyl-CoA desaturase